MRNFRLDLVPKGRDEDGRGPYWVRRRDEYASGQLAQVQRYLRSLGPWAPVVSIALMIAEAIAVPVTIMMVANGLVFGVWNGMLVSLAGGLAGTIAAYFIGRLLGRPVVERFVPASGLATADRLMAKYGRWAIVLERWIPGCDPMSYAAGILRIHLAAFLIYTTIGLLPAVVVTAFVGVQVADDVPIGYWLSGIAAVVAVWAIWRAVKKRRAPARASRSQE